MLTVDEYLSKLNPQQKLALERIRKIVHAIVPNVTEVISYGMPVFKYKGKYLIGMAAFKDHMSIFPGSLPIELLSDMLKDYKTSKGTIQFTSEKPLPKNLIRKILAICMADIS